MTMKNGSFWEVTSCSLVHIHRSFEETNCLFLESERLREQRTRGKPRQSPRLPEVFLEHSVYNYAPCLQTFFFLLALSAHSGPRPLTQFRNHFSWMVGLIERVISPSQGRYLNTGQHKHKPNIHALCGIRTHDPSVRAREESSCLRPHGYRDRPQTYKAEKEIITALVTNLTFIYPRFQ
jgi:hypothetical protein